MKHWLVLLTFVSWLIPQVGHALPTPAIEDLQGWAWEPVRLYQGIDPSRLEAVHPYVPAKTAEGVGSAVAGPGLAVAFWNPTLSTVRVRKTNPADPGVLRFRRLETGRGAGYALVSEPGLAVADGDEAWLLTQPPGGGGVWIVDADVPTAIIVESPSPRSARLIWEFVEDQVLRWIDEGGEPVVLPPVDGQQYAGVRLAAEAEIADLLSRLPGGDDEKVRAALVAWRKASALAQLWRLRPLSRPMFAHRRYKPLGADKVPIPAFSRGHRRLVDDPIDHYYRLSGDGATTSWIVTVGGPGVVRVSARQLLGPDHDPNQPIRISVLADGRRLAEVVQKVDRAVSQTEETQNDPFPVFGPLLTRDGVVVSTPVTLSVPLPPGRDSYEIRIEGADMGRAKIARRVERTARSARGTTVRGQIRRARAELKGTASLASRVAGVLLDNVEGKAPTLAEADLAALRGDATLLSARLGLSAVTDTALSRRERAEIGIAAAKALPNRGKPTALELVLRRELFELFASVERPDLWIPIVKPRLMALDMDTFSRVAMAVDDQTQLRLLPGLFDVIARGVPLQRNVRRALSRLWARMGWDRLEPQGSPDQWRFVESAIADPTKADPADGPQVTWALARGRAIEIDVPPSPDPMRPLTVLEVLGYQDPERSGVWSMQVDGRAWHSLAFSVPETFGVALPPGRHSIEVRGPPKSHALAFLPRRGASSSLDDASVNTGYAVRDGPLVVPIQPGEAGAVVRVDLRLAGEVLPSSAMAQSLKVTLDGDERPRAIEYRPRPRDPSVLPLRGPPVATSRVTIVLPVGPKARSLRIDPGVVTSGTLVASISVRRWGGPVYLRQRSDHESLPEVEWVPPEDPYAELASVSRTLVERPRDVAARLRRANLLLDLGYADYARRDFERAVAQLPGGGRPKTRARVAQVGARIEAARSDRFVAIEGAPPDEVHLVSPALGLLGLDRKGLARQDVAAMQARLQQFDSAVAPTSDATLSAVLSASVLDAQGKWISAGRAWAKLYDETGRWQFAWASTRAFLAALAGESEATEPWVGLSYGVAVRLEDVLRAPSVRRLQSRAAARSRWKTLTNAERSASTERITRELERSNGTRLPRMLRALLGAPWPDQEFVLIREGRSGVVEFSARKRREMTIQVWCAAVQGPPRSTKVSVLVDRVPTELSVEAGKVATFQAQVRPGRRNVSTGLLPEEREHVCGVRYAWTDGEVVPAQREERWIGASPRTPARVVVSGPTTLRVRARARGDGGDTLAITARALDGEAERTMDVALPAGADERAVGRGVIGPEETALLLLTESTPYVVDFGPQAGSAVVRLSLRQPVALELEPSSEQDEIPAPSDEGLWPRVGDRVTPVGVAEQQPIRANRVGTGFLNLRYLRDDVDDNDDLRPRNAFRLTLGFRRQVIRRHLWLRLSGHMQARDQSGVAGGGDLTLFGQLHPKRLRGRLRVGAWGEDFAGASAAAVRTDARVDRPVPVSLATTLIPSIRGVYRYQTLQASEVGLTLENPHPQVYTPYAEDHPFLLTPEAAVRWRPLQDVSGTAYASVTPNTNFASTDHLDLGARARGVVATRIPLVLLYRADYEASPRFDDDDRSAFFVRHRIGAGVGVAYRIIGLGRLLFDIRNSVYLTGRFPVRNAVMLTLGFEFGGGRGVIDSGPNELEFRDFHQQQWHSDATLEELL